MYSSLWFVLAALVEYKNISKKTLQESIESEMSGNLEKLLVAVGEEKRIICVFIRDMSNSGLFSCCMFISTLDKFITLHLRLTYST